MKNEETITGMYILDLDGKEVEVTDLKTAIEQCKGAVAFHVDCIKKHAKNKNEVMFKGLKEYWEHSLFELEKIALKNPQLLNPSK